MAKNNEASSSMVYLDSLPYVDAVHEDYEDYALALIEEEMKQFNPRTIKKMHVVQFRSSMMQREYESLVMDDQFSPRTAASFQPKKISRPETAEGWVAGIRDAKCRHEAERVRGIILDAEKEEAVSNWKGFNMLLEENQIHWLNYLQRQREIVEEINYQRQQVQQNQLGPQLEKLNTDYQNSVYRRNQFEHAIEGARRS